NHAGLVTRLSEAGVPVIDGTRVALKAVKHMLAWRDRPEGRTPVRPKDIPQEAARVFGDKLASGSPWGEIDSLALLAAYGIKTARSTIVHNEKELAQAGLLMEYPVVLK